MPLAITGLANCPMAAAPVSDDGSFEYDEIVDGTGSMNVQGEPEMDGGGGGGRGRKMVGTGRRCKISCLS